MGPYKALRDWVDEFIPYYIYGNNGSLDPGTSENLHLFSQKTGSHL